MADRLNDGNNRFMFVPSIANIAAPTVAELTATGVVLLQCRIKSGGVDHGGDEDTVDNSKLCDTANYETPGRIKWTWTLTYARGDTTTDDAPYSTMKRFTTGFLVVRRGVPQAQAIAANDIVDVYSITCGAQVTQPPEPNSVEWVQQKLWVSGQSEQDATVAA